MSLRWGDGPSIVVKEIYAFALREHALLLYESMRALRATRFVLLGCGGIGCSCGKLSRGDISL